MRVLLENTTFLLHKIIRIAGIIRGNTACETPKNTAATLQDSFMKLGSKFCELRILLPIFFHPIVCQAAYSQTKEERCFKAFEVCLFLNV